jgi:phosphoribosylanthranilate isomerase
MITSSQKVRIKVCGITTVGDALMAVDAGADAIGLVFYKPSPRFVSVIEATAIAQAVGPFVTVVGLFVDASKEEVDDALRKVDLHVLQFHGNETEAYCRQFNRPYMKAIRMKPELDIKALLKSYTSATAILLDAYQKGVPGGTGATFDWQRVPEFKQRSAQPTIVLAGGLTPSNVRQAITKTNVYGVDVSGGVEESPGKKSTQLVTDFILAAKCH